MGDENSALTRWATVCRPFGPGATAWGNGDVGCYLSVLSTCWWRDQVQEVHLSRVGARGHVR